MKEIIGYVFGEAAKSNIEKRKVGCVIVDGGGRVVGKGYNQYIPGFDESRQIEQHAEVSALRDSGLYVDGAPRVMPYTVYVSHQPCPDCASKLLEVLGPNVKIEVVKEFMKFDGDKTRYDLVPPSAIKGMAEVLTFGARKYKPNNWQQCEEPERYLAAMLRHIEAWRTGETTDPDSGMHHLAHAMTNMAFMLDLGYNPTNWSKKDGE